MKDKPNASSYSSVPPKEMLPVKHARRELPPNWPEKVQDPSSILPVAVAPEAEVACALPWADIIIP
jgi:hypothetical protein